MSEDLNYQRRKFLTAGISPGAIRPEAEPFIRQPLQRQMSHFERYSKNAMTCEFELLLNLHQYKQAAESALAAFAILDSIEDQMSIYRESSELSGINRSETGKDISVDDRLFDVLQLAQQIHTSTRGAFDITATPLSRLWGFNQRQGSVPEPDAIQEAMADVGMEYLALCDDSKTLRTNTEGLMLDLGGIGKGFAVDLAAESLLSAGVRDFVLQGGQSSVAAYGSNMETDQETSNGWRIGLSHPTTPDCRLAEFELTDQKLGTSGTGRQGFYFQGRRYGHIIDPRSGYPTDHCLSSTVICDSAAVADALATAFFVMQLDEVQEYCDSNKNVAAILVYPDDKAGVFLQTFNCDRLDWKKMI